MPAEQVEKRVNLYNFSRKEVTRSSAEAKVDTPNLANALLC